MRQLLITYAIKKDEIVYLSDLHEAHILYETVEYWTTKEKSDYLKEQVQEYHRECGHEHVPEIAQIRIISCVEL